MLPNWSEQKCEHGHEDWQECQECIEEFTKSFEHEEHFDLGGEG